MFTLLTLLACGVGAPPDALSDCGDLECKRAWMTANWEASPEAVMDAVAAEADPAFQTVLVQDLSEAHPGHTASLCERLPAGPAQRRCRSLNTRPHLWQIDVEAPSEGKQGSGKVFRTLKTREPVASPWDGQEPRMAPCPSAEGVNTCQSDLALSSAIEGRYRDAGLACQGVPEEKWRYECFFEAADVGYTPGEGGRIPEVLDLCMGGGPYLSRCLGHLMVELGRLAPPSEVAAPEAWGALNGLASEVRGSLKSRIPELLDRAPDRMWAGAMALSYLKATRVTGLPLASTEPAAIPHIRAAAASRLWTLEGEEARGAAEWVARLKAALADKTPSEAGGPLPEEPPAPGPGDWEDDLAGEEGLPRITYIGDAWRATARDEDTDLLICLLEAAARGSGARAELFTDALTHADPLVRWTAVRLLAADEFRKPIPGLLAAGAKDEHPLVKARAERGLAKQTSAQ